MANTIKVGVVGATGYTGFELVRYLSQHPCVTISHLFSRQQAGKKVSAIWSFYPDKDQIFEVFLSGNLPKVDCLFLGLPHGQTHAFMADMVGQGIKLIDLSADFRLQDLAVFKHYYHLDHDAPDLVKQAAYGLPELYHEAIAKTSLCANPGCYATGAILGLYPLSQENALEGTIVVDAKSGVTGSGKKVTEGGMYCEVNENLMAYSIGDHRHVAEMKSVLGGTYCFTPHLVPMNRGILSVMYVENKRHLSIVDLEKIYAKYYGDRPFVQVSTSRETFSTRDVAGTNNCQITLHCVGDKIVVLSAIDNLGKGASGQAVQNMNVMFGLDDTTGLDPLPYYL